MTDPNVISGVLRFSPLDGYQDLIGRTLRIENADRDMINAVDTASGTRFWIESSGKFLVFRKEKHENDLSV